MMSNQKLVVLGLILMVVVAGCGRKSFSMNSIPGEYAGNYGGAAETFQFNTNGTFIQQLYVNGVCQYTNEGKWTIEKKPGKFNPTSHIALSSFLCAFDISTGKLALSPLKYSPYYADWDQSFQRIEFDFDSGYFISKTKGTTP